MVAMDDLMSLVPAYVDSHLERGELFRQYAHTHQPNWHPEKLIPKTFAGVIKEILDQISVGISGVPRSSDPKTETALLVLTDRRFLYANVVVDRSGGKTVILPFADTDEFQSLSLSDIHSAKYESGFVKGTLTVRLNNMSELAFFFYLRDLGQMAEELAEMINSEKGNR